MRGVVIVLTGPSSVGKSAIAAEVQRMARRPTVYLSPDAMDLPPDAAARTYLRAQSEPDQLRWQEAVHRSFYRSAAVWAGNGLNVVAEAIFKAPGEVAICREELAGTISFVVRLVCDAHVRLAREAARGDRVIGTSEVTANAEYVPPDVALELDTTVLSASELAPSVAALLDA